MTEVGVNDFQQEVECVYEGERYSVRDNGAVLRHSRAGKRKRALDNQWTFGKENSANPYLCIAGVRIHRIVATAFHGDPPDPKHVVDHIDSNCRNNRPENLRWLTRLENSLKNPATRKKIEYLCGSIDAFLDNPSMLNEIHLEPNIAWMRAVTPEEARNCKVRMDIWADSKTKRKSTVDASNRKSSFGDRVFKLLQKWEIGFDRELGISMALTPWCAQYFWRTSAYFPCCPQEFGADPLRDYYQCIKSGAVLAYSDHEEFCPKLTVFESVLLKAKSSILVMTQRKDGKWVIVGIEFHKESRHFIHFILGTYSNMHEAGEEFSSKEKFCNFWSDGYANFQGIA
ncbi:MAG: HNH endonuclease signature motif containing protein [Woeseia sp.]